MEELYKSIEDRIKASGCPIEIDGRHFYQDVSDEADNQSPGMYLFVIKKDNDITYQGCMDIFDDQFDLHYTDILIGNDKYHVDFD